MPFSSLCIIVCFPTCFLLLVTQSCLTLQSHELYPTRLLCQWNSPGKNTELGSYFLLQGVFPTQVSNWCLLHCRVSLPSESLRKPLGYPYPSSKIQVSTGKWRDLFSSDTRGKSSMMLCKNKLTLKIWILEWNFFTNEDKMFYKD